MTRRLRIGVDLDGVVYRWSDTARWLLNWRFGLDVGESTHWNYIMDRVSPEQWKWLWRTDEDGGIGRGLFRHGNCYKGSFETLKELDVFGDIVIITHRPKAAGIDTMDWLAFNKIPTSNVHLLYQEEPKSSIKPECDIYVDDKPSNCIDLAENTSGIVCLWSRPANQDSLKSLPKDIEVIQTWTEFSDIVKETAWLQTVS